SSAASVLPLSVITQQLTLLRQGSWPKEVQMKAGDITAFLQTYWMKAHRSVCIDAGTTPVAIAKVLSNLRLPDAEGLLRSLDVFTNSFPVLEALRDPQVSAQVAMLGGRMRKDTEAVSGELTRQCLDAWRLHLDIAFVGTANINFAAFDLACASEDEALAKSLILNAASLRCVVADSSKFRAVGVPSTFPFSSLNGRSVDLIITDDKIEPHRVNRIVERGVVVLTPSGDHV